MMIIDQLPTISLPVQNTDELPIERGTQTYKVSVGNSFVKKAGDTMTGQLIIDSSTNTGVAIKNNSDDVTVPPISLYAGKSLTFVDKNGVPYGTIRPRHYTDGKRGVWMYAIDESNNNFTNSLELYVDANGNRTVIVSDAAPWLDALGLGTSGALPITVAQGGTGQTSVTSTSTISQIATAASGFSLTSATYAQWGKFAMININFKCITAKTTTAEQTVCTLVSGKRPVIPLNTVDNAGSRLYIGSTGNCNTYKTIDVDTVLSIRTCYLLP